MPWAWWPVIAGIVVIGVLEVASGFNYEVYIPVSIFLVGFFVVPLLITGLVQVRVEDGLLHAGKQSIRVTELTSIRVPTLPRTCCSAGG